MIWYELVIICGTVGGTIVGSLRYISQYATNKLKQSQKTQKDANKPKGLFDTILDSLEQAPRAKQLLDTEIENLMQKGATPEQLKSLKAKKQMVDLAANPYVQMIGPGILDNVRGFAKNFGIR